MNYNIGVTSLLQHGKTSYTYRLYTNLAGPKLNKNQELFKYPSLYCPKPILFCKDSRTYRI